ncbi:MAG: hypothetical protein ICV64_03505 [Thermoleophilia bacterium]|nr:hypothetical protein [Thermoleophilia bacterium]
MASDAWSSDRFLIDQLVRPVANLYRVTPLAAGDTPAGGPVAFVRQKRMALKEDIRFFADEDERDELFRLKARQMLDVRGRFDVTSPAGEPIGVLDKQFARSLLRSTWNVLDAGERQIAVAEERSVPVALLRRVIDFVPYGELVPILFHFTIRADRGDLGSLTRRWGLRDRYMLDLSGDPERTLDRRLGVALAIALDALQSR